MTFWQEAVSFSAHLPHFPSPLMVISLPSSCWAKAGDATRASIPIAAADAINSFFMFVILLIFKDVRLNLLVRRFPPRGIQSLKAGPIELSTRCPEPAQSGCTKNQASPHAVRTNLVMATAAEALITPATPKQNPKKRIP